MDQVVENTTTTSEIGTAICAVKIELKRLAKADTNKFASYDFTSVDDFKDELRPLLAKFGLWTRLNQLAFTFVELKDSKGKDINVAQFDYTVTLCHVSGESEPPEEITVCLPFTGAQTTGASRSYAIKEWMKPKFFASSGDQQAEADLMDQEREGMRLAKADARPLYKELQDELRTEEEGRDHEAVAKWWKDNRERIESLPKDWFLNLKNDYAKSYTDLKAQADLDKMSNEKLDELALQQEENSNDR